MRSAVSKGRQMKAVVALTLILTMLGFALPCESFAEDGTSSLKERQVYFRYSYTDSTGLSREEKSDCYDSSSSLYPACYSVNMYRYDADHAVSLESDSVIDGLVTLESMNTDVLDIDSAGNVTLKKDGRTRIKATVAADETYDECIVYLGVTVDSCDGWVGTVPVHYEGWPASMGLDLDTTDRPQKLVVTLMPGATASFTSDNPDRVVVDQDGWVTPLSPGTAQITVNVDDGGGRYKAGSFYLQITVTGEDLRSPQEITGNLGPFEIDWHDGLALDLHAENALTYSIATGGTVPATVDQNGFVKPSGKGKVRVKVQAESSTDYKPAEVYVDITARDYAEEEEAARKAAEEARLKTEIARAKALKRPTLKAVALGGRKVKLTWSKVSYASGYSVYVRYPGTRKYVRAVTKSAAVKSVTHKGLSRNKVYYYKVRAYKRVNGKTYYGPFSLIKKVRVK